MVQTVSLVHVSQLGEQLITQDVPLNEYPALQTVHAVADVHFEHPVPQAEHALLLTKYPPKHSVHFELASQVWQLRGLI